MQKYLPNSWSCKEQTYLKKKKKKLTLKKALPQFFNLTAQAAEEEYLWEHGKTT